MTSGPTDRGPIVPCTECCGTGFIELVMSDLSREPWPCFYCEAGARIREARDRAGDSARPACNNTGEEPSQGATTMTNTERQSEGARGLDATEGQTAVPAEANRLPDITGLLKRKDRETSRGVLPSGALGLSRKVRLFSRREKEAVLLSFLLSERIREDQLDSIIDLLVAGQ
ncbi:MAG TPA: hypothetical protein VI756_01810 [Blastocatellia bacterium]